MKSMYDCGKEPMPRCQQSARYLPKPAVLLGMAVFYVVVGALAAQISPAMSKHDFASAYATRPVVAQQAGAVDFAIDLLKKRLSRRFWTLA
jgi:hypothetical protein